MKCILVSSSKGGTGKSTAAIGIALGLAEVLAKAGEGTDVVGVVDADVDSPNLPLMLGLSGKMEQDEDRQFIPMVYEDDRVFLKVVSTAFFSEEIAVLSKTGDENRQIVKDLVRHTDWDGVKYLVVDTPPGASDELRGAIAATGGDLLGTIVVSLPITVQDLVRTAFLCARHEVRILGVVENMTGALCLCGKEVVCAGCNEKFHPLNLNPKQSGLEEEDTVKGICGKIGLRYLGGIPLVSGYFPHFQAGSPWLPEAARGAIREAVNAVLESAGSPLRSAPPAPAPATPTPPPVERPEEPAESPAAIPDEETETETGDVDTDREAS